MTAKRKARKVRKAPQRGKGWFSDALKKAKDVAADAVKAVHKVAKERKVLSGTLKDMLGKDHFLTEQARKAGYGHQAGAGIFGDIGGMLGNKAGNALGGILGFGHKPMVYVSQAGGGAVPRVVGGIVAPNRDIMF